MYTQFSTEPDPKKSMYTLNWRPECCSLSYITIIDVKLNALLNCCTALFRLHLTHRHDAIRSIDDGCSHSLHMQLSKPLHAACACTRNIRALGPHSPCALHFLLHKHVPEKDVTSYIAAMCCMHSLFAHRLFILCSALSLLTLSSTDLLHARFTVNKLPWMHFFLLAQANLNSETKSNSSATVFQNRKFIVWNKNAR
jgi:hypothetical protein